MWQYSPNWFGDSPILYQNCLWLLCWTDKVILKFIWKCKGPKKPEQREERTWVTYSSKSQNLQSHSFQDSAALTWGQTCRSGDRTDGPGKLSLMADRLLKKYEDKAVMEKIVFLTNGAGEAG